MWRVRTLAVLLAVAAIGLVVADAHGDDPDDLTLPPPRKIGPNEAAAVTAYADAQLAVGKRDRACVVHLPVPPATATHDAPAPELLAGFAVLRRPAAATDAIDPVIDTTAGQRLAVDYARRVRLPNDGGTVWVVPAISAPLHFAPPPSRCRTYERAELERRLRGKPAQVRRTAERLRRARERQERKLTSGALPPIATLLLFERHAGRVERAGGGDAPRTLLARGAFTASGVGGVARSRLLGLVPDGVAKIDFEFAKGKGRDPFVRRAPTYRHVHRQTAKVVDNVVALTVPRDGSDVLYNRQVWRDAAGKVVKVLPPRDR